MIRSTDLPRSSVTTRLRILERGADLVSEMGLEAVSIGMLAKETGMSKSGLFAHFNSKEALQIALLERAAAMADSHVVDAAKQAPPGLPRLRSLMDHWFGWPRRAGLAGGCPVVAGMFELDDVAGPVRDALVRLEGRWRRLLADWTEDAVEAGDLRPDLDVGQFVWEVCGIYLSHHASARFLRDKQADARARTALDALFERAAP